MQLCIPFFYVLCGDNPEGRTDIAEVHPRLDQNQKRDSPLLDNPEGMTDISPPLATRKPKRDS